MSDFLADLLSMNNFSANAIPHSFAPGTNRTVKPTEKEGMRLTALATKVTAPASDVPYGKIQKSSTKEDVS